MPTRILSVTERNGLFRIRTSDNQVHATKNAWLASVAERYKISGELVEMHDGGGWFYRNVRAIEPVSGMTGRKEPTA